MPKKRLNTFERDILNEVGSMCAGNATTALAQILDRRIDLHFPKIEFVTAEKLPWYISKHPEEIVIGVHMHILGGMRGNALLVFPKKYAFDIIDILIGPFENKNDAPTEIGISALKEMGNVVISAYLSSLTAFTGISAFSSTVNLTSGAAKYLVNLAFAGLGREDRVETVLIEAIFKEKKRDISGNFFIIFGAQSIRAIIKKAKNYIKKRGRK